MAIILRYQFSSTSISHDAIDTLSRMFTNDDERNIDVTVHTGSIEHQTNEKTNDLMKALPDNREIRHSLHAASKRKKPDKPNTL